MAENMPEYFSKAVILSSYYTSNKNCSNIEIPVKG